MESSSYSMNSKRLFIEKYCLSPLQKHGVSMNGHKSDRFIPARESMDFDVARFMIRQKPKENRHSYTPYPFPSKNAYKKEMAATLLKNANAANNNCRIFSFEGKSSTAFHASQKYVSVNLPVTKRACRYISPSAERTLDAPGLLNDYYLNLLDWSSTNVLSVALGNTAGFLHMAQSPDGYTVISAAADETLRFWKIFGAPDTSKNDNTNDADTSKNDNTKDAKVAFSNFHTHIR